MAHPAPAYTLTLDGQVLDLRGRLMSLTLTDNRGFEADTLDLTLDDADGTLSLPPRNVELRMALGWEGEGLVDKGSYLVDEIEHSGAPDVLTIRARAADMRGGLTTQRERSWHATTLGAIVKTLADENDLLPACAPGLSALAIEHEDQTNESAASFLTRLAQRHDAIATVKSGRLLLIPAGGGATVSGKALPVMHITRADGDSHRFSLADRQTYSGVRANYHDTGKAEKGEVLWGKMEDSAETGKAAPAAPAATTSGQYQTLQKSAKSRARALRWAKAEWKALKANAARRAAWVGVKVAYADPNLNVSGTVQWGQAEEAVARAKAARLVSKDPAKAAMEAPALALPEGGESNVKILRHLYASKESARRAARAEWRRLQRGMATFSMTLAIGRPELIPEQPVTVSGFKAGIDNTDWILTRVVHSLSESGLTTALELEIKATELPA